MLRFLAVAFIVVAFALLAAMPLISGGLNNVPLVIGAPVITGQDMPDLGDCAGTCRNRP